MGSASRTAHLAVDRLVATKAQPAVHSHRRLVPGGHLQKSPARADRDEAFEGLQKQRGADAEAAILGDNSEVLNPTETRRVKKSLDRADYLVAVADEPCRCGQKPGRVAMAVIRSRQPDR